MNYLVEATAIREDPRWKQLKTWAKLFKDMVAKYGATDALEVWVLACNMGGVGE